MTPDYLQVKWVGLSRPYG